MKLNKCTTVVNFKPKDKLRKLNDHSGKKYGKLQVLDYIGLNHRRHAVYSAVCDCGQECLVAAEQIVTESKSSCGCLGIERLKEHSRTYGLKRRLPPEAVAVSTIFHAYKNGAKTRNYIFELNKEDVKNLIFKECHYCGTVGSNLNSSAAGGSVAYNGIDRKDNTIGYILDNCLTCCNVCNYLKSNTSYEEFLAIIKKIYEYSFKLK